jgi:hypothetical protein
VWVPAKSNKNHAIGGPLFGAPNSLKRWLLSFRAKNRRKK